MLHKLRSRYDEAYRIRHGWGLSPLRNRRELKALIAFCMEQLGDEHHMDLNEKRKLIYLHTVNLYRHEMLGDKQSKKWVDEAKLNTTFYAYVEDNVGWYWS